MSGKTPSWIASTIASQCPSRVRTASYMRVEKVEYMTTREGSISAKRVVIKRFAWYDGSSHTANGDVTKLAMGNLVFIYIWNKKFCKRTFVADDLRLVHRTWCQTDPDASS